MELSFQMNQPALRASSLPKMDIRGRAVKGRFALQHHDCEFLID
ncbi:hypothetical protein [Aquamicrobium terrae]|uniref:Uncharacterized protein n=1 Tax=Aquamicrobium terrae TaxID=1324945 RepID=A0ABV2MVI4_9HYPH